jgi:hypothetical protein
MPEEENELDGLIEQLANSPDYETTKSIIRKLSENDYWTGPEIDALCMAALSNTQIEEIIKDEPVNRFYTNLLRDLEITDGPTKDIYNLLNSFA